SVCATPVLRLPAYPAFPSSYTFSVEHDGGRANPQPGQIGIDRSVDVKINRSCGTGSAVPAPAQRDLSSGEPSVQVVPVRGEGRCGRRRRVDGVDRVLFRDQPLSGRGDQLVGVDQLDVLAGTQHQVQIEITGRPRVTVDVDLHDVEIEVLVALVARGEVEVADAQSDVG